MSVLFCLLIFIVLNILLSNYAKILKLIDKPNERKKHIGEVPIVGGISLILSLFCFYFIGSIDNTIKLILLTSIPIFISGFLDDLLRLSVLIRVIIHIIAAFLMVYFGIKLLSLGSYEIIGTLNLGFIAVPFTIISVVLLTNSFNWIDGIDGLATIMFLQSLLAIVVFLIINKSYFELDSIFTLLILNSFLFLFFNLGIISSGKMFLGDSGSVLLGYLLSWILIYFVVSEKYILHPVLVAWSIAFPIFDIISTIIKRILLKKNPFSPDRLHLHHFLQDKNLNDKLVLFILFIISVILSLVGGLLFYYLGAIYALVAFIIIFISYIFINLIYVIKL